jgi:hypothetical protein
MKYGFATVIVTVGGSASAVTVNGVSGTSSDGQSWQVDNVPLPPGGTVTLQATAQLAGGGTLQVLLEQEREPIVFTQVFDYKVLYTFSTGSRIALRDIPFHWVRGSGCAPSFTYSEFNLDTGNTATHEDAFTWPADNGYLPSLPGQRAFNDYVNGVLWHSFTQVVNPPAVERVDISTSWGRWPDNCHAYWRESSGVEVRLFTGGKALRKGQGLFDLSAGLAYADCLDTAVSSWCASSYDGLFLWLDYPPVAVPSEEIALGALGNLGSDGHLWTVQQDGVEVIITPQVSSFRSASALPTSACGPFTNVTSGARGDLPQEQKYVLVSTCVADYPTNKTRLTIGVGEEVDFSFNPPPPASAVWKTDQGTLSSSLGPSTRLTAPNTKGQATVTATLPNAPDERISFTVVEPTGVDHAIIIATNIPAEGTLGQGDAGAQMELLVFMAPTNVSFYRVQMEEVDENGTNITGYFTQWTPQQLHHWSARANWFYLTQTNSWTDDCWIMPDVLPQPWSSGSFAWHIPWRWGVPSGGYMFSHDGPSAWWQVFTIDSLGTAKMTKFNNNWVQRTTNNVITLGNTP